MNLLPILWYLAPVAGIIALLTASFFTLLFLKRMKAQIE